MMRSVRIGMLAGVAVLAATVLPASPASADRIDGTLDADLGFIQGHSRVTVEVIVDENEPPDARIFAFFKGLEDPADGNGELTVEVGLR